MDELFYPMIFKRKSFHAFREYCSLSQKELEGIKQAFNSFVSLEKNIKVEMKIVPQNETTCKRGEYCILLFSEKKDNYLKNIGYIGEQLDLWLAAHNVGVCWYGAGKMRKQYDTTLDFVIMLAIQKVPEDSFRKDMFRSKRKAVPEIWQGEAYRNIADIIRFAPSACNLQPWFVISSETELNIYKAVGTKRGIMPASKVEYYSEIDIGIFLCFLELCMGQERLSFHREVLDDGNLLYDGKLLCAKYQNLRR